MATVGQLTVIAPAVVDNAGVWGVKVLGRDSIPICTFTAPPYTCSWTPSAPGVQTIRVVAVDAAGNSAVASANVIVNPPSDTLPPAVALSAPTSVAAGVAARLAATASDNVAVLYAAWLLYACGAKYLLLSALLYVPGAVLYAWARRQHGWALLSRGEWLAFAGLLGAGAVALSGLKAGWLSL